MDRAWSWWIGVKRRGSAAFFEHDLVATFGDGVAVRGSGWDPLFGSELATVKNESIG